MRQNAVVDWLQRLLVDVVRHIGTLAADNVDICSLRQKQRPMETLWPMSIVHGRGTAVLSVAGLTSALAIFHHLYIHTAVRLLVGTKKHDHIKHVLRNRLHWLRVP